jgi:microcystin-dependent protein
MAVLSKVANIAVQPQPVGVIEAFAGSNAPNGWLICDGSQVSRSLYPELFSVIGTTYGSGDGFTTFTLPDLRGRTIAGRDGVNNMNNGPTNRLTSTHFGASGTALGNSGGNEAHTLTTAQLASHNHTGTSDGANTTLWLQDQAGNPLYRLSGYTGSSPGGSIGGWALNNGSTGANDRLLASAHTHTFTTATNGSGNAHNNTQPTIILNYIIKAVSELPRGGWYNSSSPDLVTSLPTNPYVGQEVYHQINGKLYAKRYNGATWQSLVNTNVDDLPSGTVIQAVQRVSSTYQYVFNNFLYTECYCYITPLISTSKILCMASASIWTSSTSDGGYGGGIYSNVGGQLIQVSRIGHGFDENGDEANSSGFTYLRENHNTTSSHYYQLTADPYRNNAATGVYCNRSYQQTDYSVMTLLEIK